MRAYVSAYVRAYLRRGTRRNGIRQRMKRTPVPPLATLHRSCHHKARLLELLRRPIPRPYPQLHTRHPTLCHYSSY